MHIKKLILPLLLLSLFQLDAGAQEPYRAEGPRFSTNGYFKLPSSEAREVYSFNNGWLFYKGDAPSAGAVAFKDADWQQVSLPHGIDLLPEEASGGVNYQGVVWYRKHFKLPSSLQGKKISLSFEAVMGKSKVYLNGKLVATHFGGYLPIVIEPGDGALFTGDQENVIAVMADNSDDPSYPMGKPQYALDFCYFGGIYRNVWLQATDPVHITDPNSLKQGADGGVKVVTSELSSTHAKLAISVNIQNESSRDRRLSLTTFLKDKDGQVVASATSKLRLNKSTSLTERQQLQVNAPLLWHPDHPYLYDLYTEVKDGDQVVDGFYKRIGIKTVELRGKEGLYLNGAPFNDKLIGANRHQDYAYIGNGVPDNLQYSDAKKIWDAGIRILRLSHYPQAQAFMDACDELGIFTIVPTPGWQFWNNDSSFVKQMYSDIRQMIRQNRNHASLFAWEPIPNETHYPLGYAKMAYAITHEEDPNPRSIAACDMGSAGWQQFDLIYAHPGEGAEQKTDKCLFTREWGDYVDNWSAHNSPSRASMAWGEGPQLVQAAHYASPSYSANAWEGFYEAPKQMIGGCLWHFFDTQRGYHPDPFYGGVVDMFRQPKYSYWLFKSQQSPSSDYVQKANSNPYTLYIANIMSPFSAADVTVFTNCDSVKLLLFGKDSVVQAPDPKLKMPHPAIVFKDVYHFGEVRELEQLKKGKTAPKDWDAITAIGYKDGKEVIRTVNRPSKRPSKLKLQVDLEGLRPTADGSFIIPVFAEMQDERGIVKRLNEGLVAFSVEGEGVLVGARTVGINPHKIIWGTAPALVRTTLQPGKIRIIARMAYQGTQVPTSDTLEIESQPGLLPSIYDPNAVQRLGQGDVSNSAGTDKQLSEQEKKAILDKVGEDQKHFMGGDN